MGDYEKLGSRSKVPVSRRAKHQNFNLNSEGTYTMKIAGIKYEKYTLEEITPEVLALRDARRESMCMSKAEY